MNNDFYEFSERLIFSQGERGEKAIKILRNVFPDCIDVRKTDEQTDKKGVDYIVKLKGGAEIGIDIKARDKGVAKYWKNGEEDLLIETWSVYPEEKNEGVLGWTLSDKKATNYVLYMFDETESNKYYLLPFQLLRKASLNNIDKWKNEYKVKYACTKNPVGDNWRTQFICVPASVVLEAINQAMSGVSA